MSPEKLAEMSPFKAIAAVAAVLATMAVGLLLFTASGSGGPEPDAPKLNPVRAQAMMQRQRMLNEIEAESGWAVSD